MQKNIKKNKGVKDWPWWKLFTTVRPLIEVQLSEEQIRNRDEEIQQLRSKLEKVEKERNELRLSSDRLETRISELTSELTDERNTGESASQLLDAETAERLRAEKEMKELQTQYDALKKKMEVMEMEVMEARLIRAAEVNGEVDDEDTGGEWRLKYERAVREVDFTKKRLQQEFEDKLEVEQQNRGSWRGGSGTCRLIVMRASGPAAAQEEVPAADGRAAGHQAAPGGPAGPQP